MLAVAGCFFALTACVTCSSGPTTITKPPPLTLPHTPPTHPKYVSDNIFPQNALMSDFHAYGCLSLCFSSLTPWRFPPKATVKQSSWLIFSGYANAGIHTGILSYTYFFFPFFLCSFPERLPLSFFLHLLPAFLPFGPSFSPHSFYSALLSSHFFSSSSASLPSFSFFARNPFCPFSPLVCGNKAPAVDP